MDSTASTIPLRVALLAPLAKLPSDRSGGFQGSGPDWEAKSYEAEFRRLGIPTVLTSNTSAHECISVSELALKSRQLDSCNVIIAFDNLGDVQMTEYLVKRKQQSPGANDSHLAMDSSSSSSSSPSSSTESSSHPCVPHIAWVPSFHRLQFREPYVATLAHVEIVDTIICKHASAREFAEAFIQQRLVAESTMCDHQSTTSSSTNNGDDDVKSRVKVAVVSQCLHPATVVIPPMPDTEEDAALLGETDIDAFKQAREAAGDFDEDGNFIEAPSSTTKPSAESMSPSASSTSASSTEMDASTNHSAMTSENPAPFPSCSSSSPSCASSSSSSSSASMVDSSPSPSLPSLSPCMWNPRTRCDILHFAGTSAYKNTLECVHAGLELVNTYPSIFRRLVVIVTRLPNLRPKAHQYAVPKEDWQNIESLLSSAKGGSFNLVCAGNVSELEKMEAFSSARLVLCASSAEGGSAFTMQEAARMGCLIVSTDAPPMNSSMYNLAC